MWVFLYLNTRKYCFVDKTQFVFTVFNALQFYVDCRRSLIDYLGSTYLFRPTNLNQILYLKNIIENNNIVVKYIN